MNSTPTSLENVSVFSVRTILIGGVLFGLAVGVVVYLIAIWILNSTNLGGNLSPSNSQSSHLDVSENDIDQLFSRDLSQSDFVKLTASLTDLDQRELQDLIKKSSRQSWHSRLYTVQETLVELLARMSPEEAVASLDDFGEHRRHALLRAVFTHWSIVNLERALSAALNLPRADQSYVLNTIFAEQTSLSIDDLSALSSKLNFETELDAWTKELDTYEMLDQEPAKAFDLLNSDAIDDMRQIDLYLQVVEKWFQLDGVKILPQIDSAGLVGGLSGELLDYIAKKDRKATLNFLVVEDELTSRQSIGSYLIRSWTEDDAEEAFQAVQELPKSKFRNAMMQSLIYGWGPNDPNAVLERLMEIPRIYRTDAVSLATGALAADDPEGALDRVLSYRSVPGTNVDLAIENVVRTWSREEPEQALEWVQINVKDRSPRRSKLLNEVLPNYALIDPEQAMTIAVQEFNPDSLYSNLESRVISSLLYADRLDTAKELLNQVRDEIRALETVNVALEFAKNNRIDEVIALSSSVSAEEKADYFYWLVVNLTIVDRSSEIMEVVSKIPTSKLQSDVVNRMLSGGYGESNFTSDQLTTLRSYLSD